MTAISVAVGSNPSIYLRIAIFDKHNLSMLYDIINSKEMEMEMEMEKEKEKEKNEKNEKKIIKIITRLIFIYFLTFEKNIKKK